MTWFFGIVVVLALGGIALVASGRGAPMVDEYDDRPDALVPPTGDLGAADLRQVRFSLGLRGYRMSEVDTLLSRLAAQLEAQAQQAQQAPPAYEQTSEQEPVVLDKPTQDSPESRGDDRPPG
ncbi:DivIVA domain-containing protein [Nocardioides rubriscoriae]|uniref:DivIVA domain-containing protein n=1 Tax=Nocardioides rubriscoriae TaxID=642762 RepID=UPI003CCC5DF0